MINEFNEDLFIDALKNFQFPEEILDNDFKIIYPENKCNQLVDEFPFIDDIFSSQADPDQVNYQIGGSLDYNIIESYYNSNAKFNCQQRVYNVNFNSTNKTFAQSFNELGDLFREMYQRFTKDLESRDFIRIVFYHDSFNQPISLPFLEHDELTPELMITYFENVIQSYKDVKVNSNNSFTATVQIAKIISGGRKRKHLAPIQKIYVKKPKIEPTNSFEEKFQRKYCIKTIYNTDKLCALRAILIAKAYCDKDENRAKYLKPNNKQFENLVNKCAKDLGLNPEQECSINEIIKIEMYLKEYQITIIDGNGKLKEALYIGPVNKKFLYISWNQHHFNAITSIKAYFGRIYFCNYCKVGYSHLTDHYCKAQCKCCKKFNCIKLEKSKKLQCFRCKVEANNIECLEFHNKLVCDKYKMCYKCSKFKSKKHNCNDDVKYCSNCQAHVSLLHKCYIKEDTLKEKKFKGFIFFDYEATVLDGVHIPNLVIAKKICSDCIDESQISCKTCTKKIFYNNEDFCNWLFAQPYCIALAHNLKGYDGTFILNHILNKLLSIDSLPRVLMTGSKLLSIEFRHVKIIDSFSFIPMGLDKFSKTFSINEHKKGFFPHLFNKAENYDYKGPYPPKELYSPQFFSPSKFLEFEKWYNSVCSQTFDFQKEFFEYCDSDVELLASGSLAFRKIIMSQTKSEKFIDGIDPFQNSVTIASLCHFIFRNNFLQPETIGVIPKLGYNPEQRTSVKCQQWLKYLCSKNDIFIQHSRNLGEFRIKQYLVDGYCEETNTIYEFHGCVFHGCPKCYTPDTFNAIKKLPMGFIYKEHCKRMEFLKSSLTGNKTKIVEIWECEWEKEIQTNKDIKQFIDECDLKLPLNPREAFFGGRTNALKLYYCIKGNEIIKYIDITSLYPFVQKYCIYPVGHPEIITENFKNVSEYFGFIKCRILPPRKLYIPVLPLKINNKLVFTLCLKCAELKLEECQHNDKERCLEGTWVSLEIQEAIKMGYQVEKIYEVWHWKETSVYDKETKTGGLFTDYINLFLKGKQEASNFPSNVKNNDEKEQYIDDYLKYEGIHLDKESINLNSGMRTVMKLLLNSFWGRFGMNTNKVIYKIIADPKEWFKMLTNKQFIIHNVDFTHKDYLQVYYSHQQNMLDNDNHVNIAIAAFVTCHARLKLYSELKRLNQRVLYFDTDSIVFVSKDGEYEPELGDYLGQFTNEIDSKEGNFINEFVSAGPKNYAYKLDTGVTHALVKGFSLNQTSSLVINYDSIKQLVTEDKSKKLKVNQLKFSRDKIDWNVHTDIVEKIYGFVYDKRIIKENFGTLPFGF
jgi:hypothetical protein